MKKNFFEYALMTAAYSFFICSCGNSDSETKSVTTKVEGVYLVQLNQLCAYGFTFIGSTYTEQYLCMESANSTVINQEIEAGTFTIDDKTINLTPIKSSCAEKNAARPLSYSFQGTDLALYSNSKIYIMKKFETQTSSGSGSTGAVSKIGCFESSGKFTERAIQLVGSP